MTGISAPPLKGTRILSVEQYGAGPYASMYMADMGAEVLRIEAIGRHDLVKAFQPQHNGCSYAYLTLNRNKKAMGLDLSDRRTKLRHFASALSVTLHVFITTTSGISSMFTRANPPSNSCLATVEVSLKLSLQPSV